MLRIINIRSLSGDIEERGLESSEDRVIDAEERLTLLPGIIDPFVCIDPDHWESEAKRALSAGITTLVTRPVPPVATIATLRKYHEVAAQLTIPLHFHPYVTASADGLQELGTALDRFTALEAKGSASQLEAAFHFGARENCLVVAPAEDAEKTIPLAEKSNAQLLLLGVETDEQLAAIREGRAHGVLVYGEVAASTIVSALDEHRNAIWEAIQDGLIELVGSHHITNTHPSMAETLPALLRAYREKKLSLEKIIFLTHTNAQQIFRVGFDHDYILLDLQGKGHPEYTILDGIPYPV